MVTDEIETQPATISTPHGDAVVAWGTYGDHRGFGLRRPTLEMAEADRGTDHAAVAAMSGDTYSDLEVVAIDANGHCWWTIRGKAVDWIAAPSGSGRAVRYPEAGVVQW